MRGAPLLSLLAFLVVAHDAAGQSLRVDVAQQLNFGTLLAGVPETVLPTDALRAARLDLRGSGRGGSFLAWFLLPGQLGGPGGATIPLQFGPGSGGYSPSGAIGSQSAFNPRGFNFFTLPRDGTATLFLGGTAVTPAQAAVGRYTATISLVLFYLGS